MVSDIDDVDLLRAVMHLLAHAWLMYACTHEPAQWGPYALLALADLLHLLAIWE
jgi:hypothetical protein